MDFAYAIAIIIISGPFLGTVADARVQGMHLRIVRRLIGIQDGALWQHIPFDNGARRQLYPEGTRHAPAPNSVPRGWSG